MGKCGSKQKVNGKDQEQQLNYQPSDKNINRMQRDSQDISRNSSQSTTSTLQGNDSRLECDDYKKLQNKVSLKNIQEAYENRKENTQQPQPQDFEKLRVLGAGGFGKVYLVKDQKSGELFAMKQILKENIEYGFEKYLSQEKFILSLLDHPFKVRLYQAFQTEDVLYLILEFCQGGELLNFLSKNKFHNEETTKFYVAQLILIFEKLHKRKIIYRDLKPQNILLHSDGYLRLTDFGMCKLLKEDNVTYTQCGTRNYIPPEIFEHQGYNCVSDYFNLGQIAYELLTGKQIYQGDADHVRLKKLRVQEPLYFPEGTNYEIKQFIYKLLEFKPENRLGYNGIEEIKNHYVFYKFDWEKLYKKQMEVPIEIQFRNCIKDNIDLQYFNQKFIKMEIVQYQQFNGNKRDHYNRFTFCRSNEDQTRDRNRTTMFIEECKQLDNDYYTLPIEEVGLEIIVNKLIQQKQQL